MLPGIEVSVPPTLSGSLCSPCMAALCTLVMELFLEPTYGHSSQCICHRMQHTLTRGWQLAVVLIHSNVASCQHSLVAACGHV